MAKIFLIARQKGEVIENLISGLETDRQDIEFHSTQSSSAPRFIQIMADYLRHGPELIYFVLQDEKLNRLEKLLFHFFSSLPNIKLVVSFLGKVDLLKSKSLLRLCQKADILTLPTRQSLSDLRGFKAHSKRQFRALLAPPVPLPSLQEPLSSQTQDYLKYLSQEHTWTTFWDQEYFEAHRWFFESRAKEITWVFIGSRQNWNFKDFEKFQQETESWKKPPVWFEDQSNQALSELFRVTDLLFLAGLDLGPEVLHRISQLAALQGVFTILDTHQIESASRLWTVGENCELIEKEEVEHVLANQWPVRDFSGLNLRKKPRSPARATDETLNELSRWVSQALSGQPKI